MKRILLSCVYAFALLGLSVAASQVFDWRASAESAACCSGAADCGRDELCADPAAGQAGCCNPQSSDCKGSHYCKAKPEFE
jgi:hypothetical protein